MLNWKTIVQDYIAKHSNQIKKTTRPLRDHFGIGYFTYHRIDHEGKYTVLVDRPDWAEHYVSEKIFQNDPFLRHPSVYQSGIKLIQNSGTEEYRETVLKAGREILDMDLGAILIEKGENCVEFFGFSGNSKSSSLESLYLNHPQILKSFASHFKTQFKDLLSTMQGEASSLVDLKGSDFFCAQPIDQDIELSTRLEFYKDLGMKEEFNKASGLSLRERQCLKLLVEGKTAKETAAILELSPRTIEFYFENIKNKLSCWSKQEILTLSKSLLELGLL